MPFPRILFLSAVVLCLTVATSALAKKVRLLCVDCYSSASLYAHAAAAMANGDEIEWVLVQTHPYNDALEAYLSAFPAGCRRFSYDAQDPEWADRAAAELAPLKAFALLEGMDEGALAGTLLASKLKLPHNSLSMRDARK